MNMDMLKMLIIIILTFLLFVVFRTKFIIYRIEKKKKEYERKYKNNVKELQRLLLMKESLLSKSFPDFFNIIITAFISSIAAFISIYVGFSQAILQNNDLRSKESVVSDAVRFGVNLVVDSFIYLFIFAFIFLVVRTLMTIDFIALKELLEIDLMRRNVAKNRRKIVSMFNRKRTR